MITPNLGPDLRHRKFTARSRPLIAGLLLLHGFTLVGTKSTAQENLQLLGDLGSIIGSAQACGYTLNEDAVLAYVAANVPPSDTGFADDLRTNIGYKRRIATEMTGLDKRVFCEATQRSAQGLGLLATK